MEKTESGGDGGKEPDDTSAPTKRKSKAAKSQQPPSPQEKPLLKKIQCDTDDEEDDDDDEEDVSDDDAVPSTSSRPPPPTGDQSVSDRLSQLSLSEEEMSHIRCCHTSQRRLEEDDVLRVGDRIAAKWRDVGNSLHFTHAQLDQIEAEGGEKESSSTSASAAPPSLECACAELLLSRWIKWKCERATVKRLSKALYNNGLADAIAAIDP